MLWARATVASGRRYTPPGNGRRPARWDREVKVARRRTKVAAAIAPPPRPDFEFQVRGPAVSAQAKNRLLLEDWKARVTAAARSAWPDGKPPMAGDVEVWISEFSEFATRDGDNMAKPVLDAMQRVVYGNDRQVKRSHIEWCDIDGAYVVRHMSPIVAAALSVGEEFLWVRVSAHVPRKDLLR